MARSYDIAEITTADGGLPEIVRMKLNRNFRRLCQMIGTEIPSQLSSATIAMMQSVIDAWWPSGRKEVQDYTDDKIDKLNDKLLDDIADATKEAKDYTDEKIADLDLLTWQDIYPVGSIYMSVLSTSPETLFGGSWTRLEDRFLLGAGSSYTLGATGGETEHTLTIDEMPAHAHNLTVASNIGTSFLSIETNTDAATPTATTGSTGGSEPHNNMPPYLVVSMWQRTA